MIELLLQKPAQYGTTSPCDSSLWIVLKLQLLCSRFPGGDWDALAVCYLTEDNVPPHLPQTATHAYKLLAHVHWIAVITGSCDDDDPSP